MVTEEQEQKSEVDPPEDFRKRKFRKRFVGPRYRLTELGIELVRAAYTKAGLFQKGIAQEMRKHLGYSFSQATINYYITGKHSMSVDEMATLLKVLGGNKSLDFLQNPNNESALDYVLKHFKGVPYMSATDKLVDLEKRIIQLEQKPKPFLEPFYKEIEQIAQQADNSQRCNLIKDLANLIGQYENNSKV